MLRKSQITRVQSVRRTLKSLREQIEHGLVVPPVGETMRSALLARLLDAADEILCVVATEEFLPQDVLLARTQKLIDLNVNDGGGKVTGNSVNP